MRKKINAHNTNFAKKMIDGMCFIIGFVLAYWGSMVFIHAMKKKLCFIFSPFYQAGSNLAA